MLLTKRNLLLAMLHHCVISWRKTHQFWNCCLSHNIKHNTFRDTIYGWGGGEYRILNNIILKITHIFTFWSFDKSNIQKLHILATQFRKIKSSFEFTYSQSERVHPWKTVSIDCTYTFRLLCSIHYIFVTKYSTSMYYSKISHNIKHNTVRDTWFEVL